MELAKFERCLPAGARKSWLGFLSACGVLVVAPTRSGMTYRPEDIRHWPAMTDFVPAAAWTKDQRTGSPSERGDQ